jgi:hypothetical protein
MKATILLGLGLILSLSLSGLGLQSSKIDLPQADKDRINEEMQIKFDLRDSFKEKGNSGKYLRTHPLNREKS